VAATSGLVASSGEDSTVIVAHISSGEVKGRIDHHRGPVTSLAITSSGDVLISGKQSLPPAGKRYLEIICFNSYYTIKLQQNLNNFNTLKCLSHQIFYSI
jgi:WD40 repeat protein